MHRRPLGLIDPNSVHEAEAHTDTRRTQSLGGESLRSLQLDRARAATRQRGIASRGRESVIDLGSKEARRVLRSYVSVGPTGSSTSS